MRKILLRVELNGLIVIFPGITDLLLIKGYLPKKEVNSLILAVDLQTFLAILLAFLIFTHLVVHFSNEVVGLIDIWEGSNEAKCVLYECFLLSTLEEEFYDGLVYRKISD